MEIVEVPADPVLKAKAVLERSWSVAGKSSEKMDSPCFMDDLAVDKEGYDISLPQG